MEDGAQFKQGKFRQSFLYFFWSPTNWNPNKSTKSFWAEGRYISRYGTIVFSSFAHLYQGSISGNFINKGNSWPCVCRTELDTCKFFVHIHLILFCAGIFGF